MEDPCRSVRVAQVVTYEVDPLLRPAMLCLGGGGVEDDSLMKSWSGRFACNLCLVLGRQTGLVGGTVGLRDLWSHSKSLKPLPQQSSPEP